MNQHKMLEAVREGVRGAMPEGLDQLWFTEARGAYFFDFTPPITTGSDVLDSTPSPASPRPHAIANVRPPLCNGQYISLVGLCCTHWTK